MLNYISKLTDNLSEAIKKIRYERQRRKAESHFRLISHRLPPLVSGTVLVDAGWDNPNYWLRYSILRRGLNLSAAEEVGLLGKYRRREQLGTLKRLGIKRYCDLMDQGEVRAEDNDLALRLCQEARHQQDVLAWKLPLDFPADFLYDYLLKVQGQPYIDFSAPSFFEHTRLFLHHLSMVEAILETEQPSLVISSHNVGLFAPLVWAAAVRGIKVIVPFGDAGLMRFWLLSDLGEFYDFMDCPKYADFQRIGAEQRQALARVGEEALRQRLGGLTTNLGATYAYARRQTRVDRAGICREFGWNADKPIIGVYAPNWFDFPHFLGMKNFANFYDWVTATLEVAGRQKEFYWIFKPHPVDEWYGGLSLADLVDVEQAPHIRLSHPDWNGEALLETLDAFVTYHGTVGIEASALGKPVLVADQGWYQDWGFVKAPTSRLEYLELLPTQWWEEMDLAHNAGLARIFAGWYWGKPAWQNGFLLEDDSEQWKIYQKTPPLIANHRDIIYKELDLLREWFKDGHPHYHTFKMMRATQYVP